MGTTAADRQFEPATLTGEQLAAITKVLASVVAVVASRTPGARIPKNVLDCSAFDGAAEALAIIEGTQPDTKKEG